MTRIAFHTVSRQKKDHDEKSFQDKSLKAFSLIEVLITLSIIGLLSGLILPNFSKIQNKAKETTVKTLCYAIQTGIETYALNNGDYPSGKSQAVSELIETLKKSGEYTKIPNNPFSGKPYTGSDTKGKILYSYESSSNSYTLTGYGAAADASIITLTNI